MAAKLGFPGPQFHDLRGNARDIVLDRGLPVHVVAVRCGHDPATLLRSCAKRTRKAGTSVAGAIGVSQGGFWETENSLSPSWECCRCVPFMSCAKALILLCRKGGRAV